MSIHGQAAKEVLHHVGAYTGIGVAVGGAASYLNDKKQGRKPKLKNVARGAFGGALGGATIGSMNHTYPMTGEHYPKASRQVLDDYAKKQGLRKAFNPHVGTAAGAALGGAWGASATQSANKKQKDPKKRHSVLAGGLLGGATGASIGHSFGLLGRHAGHERLHDHAERAARQESYRQAGEAAGQYWRERAKSRARSGAGTYHGSSRREAHSVETPFAHPADWLKGVKTKADAKKAYRAQALKHHPDRGGNADTMKKVNQEWDTFRKHHFEKLSHLLRPFFNELCQIET